MLAHPEHVQNSVPVHSIDVQVVQNLPDSESNAALVYYRRPSELDSVYSLQSKSRVVLVYTCQKYTQSICVDIQNGNVNVSIVSMNIFYKNCIYFPFDIIMYICCIYIFDLLNTCDCSVTVSFEFVLQNISVSVLPTTE